MMEMEELRAGFESACTRITGKSLEEWDDQRRHELRRAKTMGTISRGSMFTQNEMFGILGDGGRLVRQGWSQLLGLGPDDVKCIDVDVQPSDLTGHEQYRQTKARKTAKGESAFRAIRAIRYQIRDHVWDEGPRTYNLQHDDAKGGPKEP